MARPQPDRKRTKETRTRGGKRKVCSFCKEHVEWIDYKDIGTLRRFMSERGKIRSRRVTGNCAQHQRDVQVAIKTARELALLPYLQRTTSERGLGRARATANQEGGPDFEDAGRETEASGYDDRATSSLDESSPELELTGER